MNIISLAG